MSEQTQKMEKLLSLNLNLDKFYAIRIYENLITLQGEAKKLVSQLADLTKRDIAARELIKLVERLDLEL